MNEKELTKAELDYWLDKTVKMHEAMRDEYKLHGMTKHNAELTAIICALTFRLAQQPVDYAVYLKKEEFKKTTRKTKELLKRWDETLNRTLDKKHRAELDYNIDNFIAEEEQLFNQLYLNIKQQIDKDMPQDEYSDLRAMAWRSAAMVDAYQKWLLQLETAYLIGPTNILMQLRSAMKEYAGYEVKNTMHFDNIGLCIKLITKAVTNVEYVKL